MSLDYTGERFIPGYGGTAIHLEHLHRYLIAARMVHGMVLDVGSGAGYGSTLLSRSASRVVGIDISPESAHFGGTSFSMPNLYHTAGDVRAMPFRNAMFDWAVCFELLEHIQEGETLLSEIVRVLTPGGQLILSTPNRPIYTEASGITNPFHIREFDAAELRELLAPHFEEVVLCGQRLIAGSLTWVMDGANDGTLLKQYNLPGEIGAGLAYDKQPVYMLAICARHRGTLRPEAVQNSLTAGRLETFLEEEAVIKHQAEAGLRTHYEAEVMDLCRQTQEADQRTHELGAKLEEQHRKIEKLEVELKAIHDSKMWRTWLGYHAVRHALLYPAKFVRDRVNGLRRRVKPAQPALSMKELLGRLYLMLWTAGAITRAAFRLSERLPPAASSITPGRRLRILMIFPYTVYPPDHGGSVRLYNLIRRLSRHCDLHLLVFDRSGTEQEQRSALEPFVKSLRFHQWQPVRHRDRWDLEPNFAMLFRTEEVQSLVQRTIAQEQIDVLQIEYTELGQYGMARYDGVKIVLTMYDISFRSYARRRRAGMHRRYGVDPAFGLSLIDWMRLFRYELRVARRADQIHVMSGADARYLARYLPTRAKTIRIVPNAVDLDHYTVPPPASRSARQLLFVGNFGHMPNLDALDYLMEEIWPRVCATAPDAELVIVGAGAGTSVLPYDGSDGVTVAGAVQETVPYYQACTMLVAPIRAGSGTRLKILEALACGTPVVTTTIGAEGIEGKAGEHFLIADDAAAFADAIRRLLDSPDLCARLGENGRVLVECHYGWDVSVAAALAAYAGLELQP